MSQQITLVGWNFDVQPAPDGGRILVGQEVSPQSGNAIIIPMGEELAKEIAKKLGGPSVAQATTADLRAITGGKAA